MRVLFCFILAMLLCPAAAAAQGAPATNEPRIAPAGEWVEQLAIPTPNPALRDRPFQTLLSTSQSRYGTDYHDHYLELAFLIQNGQGMQGLGNIVLPWRPDQTELIVHKVQIRRGGTVIDLLANGQRFTVLRRESNLESAVLDGMLSAVMQPEGLAVGDTLNVAWTVRWRPGTLPLRRENLFLLAPGTEIRRYFVRQLWPSGSAMRWRGTGALERPRTRTTPFGTELSVDIADVETPQPPAQAPARFNLPTTLQLSEFSDWAGPGTMLAPHYESAWQLGPESPLNARIAQIAAASQDPRARAMAALRLVQDEVRYFALVMGDGNYLPATAEQTWSRRFADCKGKVVLLIALLRGLGIDAEPVLVNTGMGDGMDERLPQLGLFDHMIVRARIDGRSYWLDGTRTGDRVLEDLASSTFGWGLPIRASGSNLERLPFVPPSLPLMEHNVTFDGSGGFRGPVPVRVEWLYRGDMAEQMRASFSQLGREAFLRSMRESRPDLPGTNDEVTTFDVRDDPAAGAFTVIFAGRARMDWRSGADASMRRFRFDNEIIRWSIDLARPAGPLQDAPYAFPVPTYLARTDTIILPRGGRDFAMEGRSLDEVVAGTRISRRLAIADGRATARSEFRRLEREVAAGAARRAEPRIDAIGDDEAWLRGPAGLTVSRGDDGTGATTRGSAPDARAPSGEPTTASEFLERGYARLQTGELDEADADFQRAATLRPDWSSPVSNQGIVRINRRDYEEAEALLSRAAELDPDDFVVYQGRGLIQLARNRPVQAVVALTRAIELRPDNSFNLMQRSAAYLQLGELGDAQADLAAILAREPDHIGALSMKARIHAWRGENGEANAAADAIVAGEPGNPLRLQARARILRRIGQAEAAAADLAQAISIIEAQMAETPAGARALRGLLRTVLADAGQTARAVREIGVLLEEKPDDPTLLNARCWTRATANFELAAALADCDRAVARAPTNASILDSRALVKLRLGQIDGAIADATAAISRQPSMAPSLYVRGLARLRKGEREAGERDLDAARRIRFDIEAEYRGYGVTP